jgi:hypothetical protein
MRLSAYPEILSQELINAFEECRILTDQDLVFSTPHDVLRKIPAGTITLNDLMACVDAIVARVSTEGQSAVEILESSTCSESLKSGIDSLDNLLSGGLKTGHVYELSGDRGAGKSVPL